MKRGFTLIELLAVIVILAIIALIATPIVLNMITNIKQSSMERSVQFYLNAVELALTSNILENENQEITGKYEIIDNGRKIKDKKTGEEIKVNYEGEGLKEGIVKIEKGKVKEIRGSKINDEYAVKIHNEIKFFKELPESRLTSGQEFNSKIKTLVSGEDKLYTDVDEIVKMIGFYSYGTLPNGYTKEQLLKLEQVDVSKNQDKTILALYDEDGNVFIYSEYLIIFDKQSQNMFNNFRGMTSLTFGMIDTGEVINMSEMFLLCVKLESLDLNNFDTSRVTNMTKMFSECDSLIELNLRNFDTSNVTSMGHMFYNCDRVEKIDVSNFNTSQVTNMNSMFQECFSLKELDVSGFNTGKVTNMAGMFYSCSKLTKIDVSKWDTGQVTNMASLFRGCISLTKIDVSNFNTSKVINMERLFFGCSSLEELNVRNFDTSKVTSMLQMFYGCSGITMLDLSNFNTSQVTNMSSMFQSSFNLKKIEVSDSWEIGENVNVTNMFSGCGIKEVTLKQ